ncbi:glycerate kinase [Arthrobacter echini]|uniref:Glycerate kinase n=1 Tax=Arthrobacter echini TaxID=1529066 RepID=A0A5D0XV49_9MICC|nr:glycerate kinase [Arthrobacter echini]TYD00624.1 glycerate kinase [Arthrobacter echini]
MIAAAHDPVPDPEHAPAPVPAVNSPRPRRVVVAPDKFRGSLSAPEVARHVANGLRRRIPELHVVEVPMADGGEGTLEAAFAAGYGQRWFEVPGPTGEPVRAALGIRGTHAVVELAAASGLALLPGGTPRPLDATSEGTGALLGHALDAGCTRIVLGVGGSACTDGGAGLLRGLGARLLDDDGEELAPGGAALQDLTRIDLTGLDARLGHTTMILASDVDNALLGPAGAAAVFGPQKGATPEDVLALDAGLAQFVSVLGAALGPRAADLSRAPGAGAAGGTGYAALAVLGAARRPGVDVVLEFVGLAGRLDGAELVITGEGSLDAQSLSGKTPVGVARLAAAHGCPVVAVCGRNELTPAEQRGAGFSRVLALTELEPDLRRCMTDAAVLLEQAGEQLAPDPPA